MSRVTLLLIAFAALLAAGVPAPAAPDLGGNGALNDDLSDEPNDAFDGKLRHSSFAQPSRGGERIGRNTPTEAAQQHYWDTIAKSRERRAVKNLRRLGTAYPLLTAERIEIKHDGEDYQFTYDALLPRAVRPNPDGRVYSASGDELVNDSIGFTLSFWEHDELVLETDPPDGGKYTERIKLVGIPARLEYSITVVSRELSEPVTVKRVYDQTGTTAQLE